MNTSLSKPERESLARYEAIIEQGLRTFLEVGTALMAIRNSRLYRERYPSFDSYLQMRWPELSSRRAYQLMEAASVVHVLNQGSMNPGSIPTSERHVRPLIKLAPDQQRVAWERALETAPNGKVTAQHVQRVVDTLKPRAVPTHDLFPGPNVHPDVERIATYHLLEAALSLVQAELGSRRPALTVSKTQAHEAARLLLESSLFKGAVSMLAASARVES